MLPWLLCAFFATSASAAPTTTPKDLFRQSDGASLSSRALLPPAVPHLHQPALSLRSEDSHPLDVRAGSAASLAVMTPQGPFQTANLSSQNVFGLPANGLQKNSIHIGALPDWSRENPQDISAALGAGISVIGDYINVSPTDYSFAQFDYHADAVVSVNRGSVKAVYAPAILFGAPCSQWTDAMTANLVGKLVSLERRGVTIWLRFLFEMNGYWMPYGQQPADYVSLWKTVTNEVRAATNKTYMLWSPNIWAGKPNDPTQGYSPYWPGQDFVDLCGLSFYWQGDNGEYNQPPTSDLFTNLFTPFYSLANPRSQDSSLNLLQITRPMPVVISETSAPFYYEITSAVHLAQDGDTDIQGSLPNISTLPISLSSDPAPHASDELYIKATWFVQMTSNTTAQAFPNLVAISLFNYFKRANAPVLADFRYILGNNTVETWLRGSIGNQTAYDLGYTGSASLHRPSVLLLSLFVSGMLLYVS